MRSGPALIPAHHHRDGHSIVGLGKEEGSGNAVSMGMLGFLLLFIAAVCTYAALLPRAKPEPLPQGY